MKKKLLTAIVTPFDENKQVDLKEFERLIEHLIDSKSDGIIIGAPTGEGSTLTIGEINSLIEVALEYKDKYNNFEIYLFSGSNDTDNDIKTLKEINISKLDGIMIIVPFFNKPSQYGIFQHYQAITKSFNNNFYIYSSPSRCGISIDLETILKLNNECKNIIGIVNDSNDISIFSYLKDSNPLFICLIGDDRILLPSLKKGADGVVSIVSHLIGDDIKEVLEDYESGFDNQSLADFINLISDLTSLETTPIPIKYMLYISGCESMNLRLPLTTISLENKRKIDMIID